METVSNILNALRFFSLLLAALVWFVVSLVGWLKARARREDQPAPWRRWRVSLILSAIVLVLISFLYVGFLVLMATALSHM